MTNGKMRVALWLGAAMLCTVSVVLLSCWGGATGWVSPWDSAADETSQALFWKIRLPRNAVGFLTGAALSLCGAVFQALFRNPLATPYTLGVASGAAFGAAFSIHLGLGVGALMGLGVRAAAAVGALASMALVYGIASRKRGMDASRMLLAGVAVSFTFLGLLLFVQYLADFSGSFRIVRWMMGSLDVVGARAPLELGTVIFAGSAVVLINGRALDLLTIGETEAMTRGLNVRRTEAILFVTASIMVGHTVSISGPIGFVGMMVPHICRRIVGPRHSALLPASFLAGGLFLVLADTLARTLISPAEIPVGVLTSLLGGPFFLALLLRGK